MKALIDNSEQGSVEWLKARISYVTASDVYKVMAKGQGVTRNNYMHKMLCEILTGEPTPTFKNGYMQNGNDREDIARSIYQHVTGETVTQLGFAYLPDEKLGASTDGLVNDKGLIEIKNLVTTEQVKLITTGKIDSGYIKQMQTQMYVLERDWCDFIGLSLGSEEHGALPDKYKYRHIRVMRDEEMIAEIRAEVSKFHEDLAALIFKLQDS